MSAQGNFGTYMCRALLAGSLITVAGCSKPDKAVPEKALAPVVTAPQRESIMPIPPDGYVTVMRGETLYTIAARYQVSPLAIIEDNQLEAPFIIGAGQQLRLSPPRFHMVFPGDSSSSIAERYGISEEQLATANGSKVPMKLIIGQRLILPAEPDFARLGVVPQSEADTSQTMAQAATSVPTPPRKQFVAPSTGGPFMWPVTGEVITEFGPAARGVHNDGINIAAVAGADVLAAAAGTVAFIGREIKSFGTLVLIKHKDGVITAYAHLDSVLIKEGDVVEGGQKIATVGQTGKVDTPQLHFEIRKARRPIDPRTLIS